MSGFIEFDYRQSKKNFIEGLENKKRSFSKYQPLNVESKEQLILFVKARVNPYCVKYDTIKDNNSELLILKRRLPDQPVAEVLPAMECFDVLAEAHLLEDHGDCSKMTNILKLIYHIPLNVVNIFLKACNVCMHRNQFSKEKSAKGLNKMNYYVPDYTVHCTIYQIPTNPDNRFSHVIIYVDALTNYVILRPTCSKDHVVVAYELLKIFLDFGLPDNIVCNSDEFYKTTIAMLKPIDIFLQLPSVVTRKSLPKLNQISNDISSLIKSWISAYKSSNWAIGLKEIQWQLNTLTADGSVTKSRKLVNHEIMSPYHAHFGFIPNEKVIQRTNKLPKTGHVSVTNSKNKVFCADDRWCLKCDKKVSEIYYKVCSVCKQKCHFNCCVISVLKILSTEDYKLEITCTSCKES